MRKLIGWAGCAVALVALVTLAACSSSGGTKTATTVPPGSAGIVYPAPANAMELARKAGLVPETAERLQYHVHAHLDWFENGKPIVVPGGIGIDMASADVQKGEIDGYPAYGGITGCAQPCISPLHTHDATGTIHTESATRKNNTFGQFLTEWNVTLPAGAQVWVNGTEFKGDPATIPLSNYKEIAVVVGTPPAKIPSSFG
jgi:hypothetical protein